MHGPPEKKESANNSQDLTRGFAKDQAINTQNWSCI